MSCLRESGSLTHHRDLRPAEIGLGLYTLPSNIGLEFEINQDNASVAAPQNVRPFCFDNSYKQRHWAVNQNYSWIATDWFGNVTATDTWMGGYADYNDATDLCRTSW
ncbi:hypothetical protein [Microcella alkaliphila]|nr:hypothetical protein [Microcella alkaliphila]